MEAKDQTHAPAADDTAAAEAARKEDATSSETLSDLAKTQKLGSQPTDNASGAPDAASVPAPDGTPDPVRNSAGDGDPM
ncbi:MAG TPA: hypothetical protein VF525_16475 [Pyrinomonadaceae bacterium]|jgi:hypothetical protein